MSRSYTVIPIDLSRDNTSGSQTYPVGYRHLIVTALPAAALGLILLSIDNGPRITIGAGYRFSATADAPAIQNVQVFGPAVGGTLELFAGGDDTVPFASTGAQQLDPYFSALWMPHEPAAESDPLKTAWIGRGGTLNTVPGFWSNTLAGPALVPLMTVGNKRGAYQRPNGGTSTLRMALFDYPWSRLRVDPTREVTSRPDPARQMLRVRLSLLQLAQGAGGQQDSGVWFAPAIGAVLPGTPSGNNPFWGISRDAAGLWRHRARAVGGAPFQIDEAINWPVALTKWSRVEFQLWDADPVLGRDGVAKLLVNDVQVAQVTDMSLMPRFTATQTGYALLVQDQGASANATAVSDCKVAFGPLGMAA